MIWLKNRLTYIKRTQWFPSFMHASNVICLIARQPCPCMIFTPDYPVVGLYLHCRGVCFHHPHVRKRSFMTVACKWRFLLLSIACFCMIWLSFEHRYANLPCSGTSLVVRIVCAAESLAQATQKKPKQLESFWFLAFSCAWTKGSDIENLERIMACELGVIEPIWQIEHADTPNSGWGMGPETFW